MLYLLIIPKSIHRKAYIQRCSRTLERQKSVTEQNEKGLSKSTFDLESPYFMPFRRFIPRRRLFLLYQYQQEHRPNLLIQQNLHPKVSYLFVTTPNNCNRLRTAIPFVLWYPQTCTEANKDRYFDTKRVEVTVFSFTQKTAQNKAFQRYCRKSRDPAGRNFRSGVVLICGFRCSDAPSNR